MDIARHHHHHHHRGRRHAPTTPRPNRVWRDTGGYRDLGPPDSAAATASVVTTAATTRGRRTPDDSAMVASQGRQIGSPAVEASLWILHALFPQPFRSCVGIEHTPTESATTCTTPLTLFWLVSNTLYFVYSRLLTPKIIRLLKSLGSSKTPF